MTSYNSTLSMQSARFCLCRGVVGADGEECR
jgi:hypothetical protein